ncbi:hypothetical protein [Stratiformator vulcanicus]|uniref:Uncharacterized protein n=1 Tax=Stratiformator vulcanicus TaxID=2527980 RepID=A0A517QZE0_9PLAN|nr:hypothetical protein [Stratiformator vulcanicus]QDT37016.1 hypothetical protein Pan189_13820 [Stratiformator vulcanicus]
MHNPPFDPPRGLRLTAGLMLSALFLCQGSTYAQEEGQKRPPSAAELLTQAREKIEGYRTLRARMIEQIEVEGEKVVAKGVYLQGANNRLRLELKVDTGLIDAKLLQVCDGDILWTTYEIGETKRILRRDVRNILRSANARGPSLTTALVADLGLGGLPAMLASIQKYHQLGNVEEIKLKGRNFYRLTGRWKEALVEEWAANSGYRRSFEHIPEIVEVFIERNELFPYRVRYWKVDDAGERRPVITIDFRDVVVNSSIDPSEFAYVPADSSQVQDITGLYLQKLQGPAPTPGSN